MPTSLKLIEEKIAELVSEARNLKQFVEEEQVALFGTEGLSPQDNPAFYELKKGYQQWYGVGCQLLQNNMEFRLKEFQDTYGKPQSGIWGGLCIKDILGGDHPTILHARILQLGLDTQCAILESMPEVIKARALGFNVLATAELLDDEIAQATYLLKRGFVRAAGAIGGVVLERHLKTLCAIAHPPVKIPKRRPTIFDLNDVLRNHSILSDADWRKVQWMADIRNACDHHRDKEPETEDIQEFLKVLDKFIKMTLS
jgi:hypothetical protein